MKFLTSILSLFLYASLFSQSAIDLQPGPADGKDAKIFNLDALANYGNDVELAALQLDYSGEPGTTRSLFEFDLNSIPEAANVIDARLSLYYNPDTQTPGQLGENAAVLRRLVVPWEESTVAWAMQPGYTVENEVLLPQSAFPDQDYIDINVTPLVQDMADNRFNSHGFILMLQDEQGVGKALKFYSSDGAVAEKRPRLVVVYSTGVGTNDIKATKVATSPNPFENSIAIDGLSGSYDVTMIDPAGKVIVNQKIESVGNTLQLDRLDGLTPGLYYIRAVDHDKVYFSTAFKAN